MKEITALVSRNRKLFFKDKGMLFSSMITPVILIVLYATFLANVYKDSFVSATKNMIDLPDKIINGTVAAQLAAALLAVSCVTVTFCVNLTMVQDRASGARKDFDVSPVSKTSVYKGYKRDKIEMRGDRAEMSDFPLYLNTVAGGLDRRDQTIGGFSFVVKIYAVPVVEIIG